MRFLVDAQLPPALSHLLARHGHEAQHVIDIGPADATDHTLWRFALENDAVLVTKDEDFSTLALLEPVAPVVVWIRVGNTRRQALLGWFEPLIDRIVALVDSGERFIELRESATR